MKGDLLERLELAKFMLRELERQGQLNLTLLENVMHRKYDYSHARFCWMFRYLRDRGFLVKSGGRHLAPYMITLRGRHLLRLLTLVFEEEAVEVKP